MEDRDDETLVPQFEWIAYREDGKVKYMRSDDDDVRNLSSSGMGGSITKPSAYADMTSGVGFLANAPQLLPERYTDDSLIPAIVTNIVPSTKQKPEE